MLACLLLTLISSPLSLTPAVNRLMSRGSCLNSCVFTEYILYSTGPVLVYRWRCYTSFFFLWLRWRLIIGARCKEHLPTFSVLLAYLSKKKKSILLPRKSIPEISSYSQRHSSCQMLMNDRQRSKLVIDTFIDWAHDLPDYDLCFLAAGSHQISGRCQLKSVRIISQTGSLLHRWISGGRNRHTMDNKL